MTDLPELAAQANTLTAILRHFDWAPTSGVPGTYEVWKVDDSNDDEIVVPLDPSRGDYSVLIERARRNVVLHYGRAAKDLLATLEMQTYAMLDSTHWTKETPVQAGLINWMDGEELYSSARAQLIASAKASREKRRYHGNASAYLAKRFIENSFMGQTDVGSFVITAYTPAQRRFHTSRHSEDIAPARPRDSDTLAGRDILATFESALKAVRTGLDDYRRTPRPEIFLETVDEGVSYELTKALANFTAGGDSSIRVSHQTPSGAQEITTEVQFEAVESSTLARVADTFALDPEPQEVTLIGEVTLLSRSSTDMDRVIRLNIEDGADIRKARIRLSKDDYDLAMEAHRQEASLRLSGRLEKEGHLYWIYGPSHVAIVPSDRPLVADQGNPTLFDDNE